MPPWLKVIVKEQKFSLSFKETNDAEQGTLFNDSSVD